MNQLTSRSPDPPRRTPGAASLGHVSLGHASLGDASRRTAGLAVFAGLAVALAIALAVFALPAAAQEDDAWLRRGLDLERRLLAQDLAAVESAQAAVAEAQASVDQAVAAVRQAAGTTAGTTAGEAATTTGGEAVATTAETTPTGLAEAATLLGDARAVLAAAQHLAEQALDRIDERLRRLVVMNGLVASAPPPAVPDVLSGPWGVSITGVTIGSADLEGVFRLQQNGTVVGGSYRLENGRTGSLRGTYVNGMLRLERVDTQSGFDAIFEARVFPQEGRMVGTWRPTILSSGGPGGGDWVGLRGEEAVEALEEEDVFEDFEDEDAGPEEAGP